MGEAAVQLLPPYGQTSDQTKPNQTPSPSCGMGDPLFMPDAWASHDAFPPGICSTQKQSIRKVPAVCRQWEGKGTPGETIWGV